MTGTDGVLDQGHVVPLSSLDTTQALRTVVVQIGHWPHFCLTLSIIQHDILSPPCDGNMQQFAISWILQLALCRCTSTFLSIYLSRKRAVKRLWYLSRKKSLGNTHNKKLLPTLLIKANCYSQECM